MKSLDELIREAQAMPKGDARWARLAHLAHGALEEAGPLTLAISGSLDEAGADEVWWMIKRIVPIGDGVGPHITHVIHGGYPTGADAAVDGALVLWAERNAECTGDYDRRPMVSEPIRADWTALGRAAGPVRNGLLLDGAQVWAGLWDGRKEKCGTWDTMNQARERGWLMWLERVASGSSATAYLFGIHPDLFTPRAESEP